MKRPSPTNRQFSASSVPPEFMRVDTVGDYYIGRFGVTEFNVADTGDFNSNILVLIHELVEYVLVRKHKIPLSEIDAFDEACTEAEPGDNPHAPYHKEHVIADMVERLVARELGLDWTVHQGRVSRTGERVSRAMEERAHA